MTAGRDLRAARKSSRITLTAVAAKMGISRQTVWMIEHRDEVDPRRAHQYRMALIAAIETFDLENPLS